MEDKELMIENLKRIMFIGKSVSENLKNERIIKQERILEETYKKCIEIKEVFSFLSEYGFTIEICKHKENDYGDYYNFFVHCVKLSRGKNKVHFAYLYPCSKNKDNYDFSSYQLSLNLGCQSYTYESGIKAIRKILFNN